MNELLIIYKVAFDNIARTIKQWNNDEEAVQADFEYPLDIQNLLDDASNCYHKLAVVLLY